MVRALWFRICHASILFWDFLTTAIPEIVDRLLFTKEFNAESPRRVTSPLKSRRRPSDAKFAFPFPTLRMGSRHSVEFEGAFMPSFKWVVVDLSVCSVSGKT
jgi:hypothetical protein